MTRSLPTRRIGLVAISSLALACGEPPPGSAASDAEPDPGAAAAPQTGAAEEAVDPLCKLPSAAETLLDRDGAVLRTWSFALEDVHTLPVLPTDSALISYRRTVRSRGADVRNPRLEIPTGLTPSEERVWQDEYHNNELAFAGAAGSIDPITCLDALLFAEQNRRVPQLERPTEFLASVLRRDDLGAPRVTVVFGAGTDLFPPRSIYGLETVQRHVDDGWRYWYALHNHTLQPGGALGVPVPSTSDVGFARGLSNSMGLESVRVTNGFYTFRAPVESLAAFRAR